MQPILFQYYHYVYSNVMDVRLREKIDQFFNGEDIVFNALVAHITRKPPIKVVLYICF